MLRDLAFACYVYPYLADNDQAYSEFLHATNGRPNMRDDTHREVLLRWLRKWRCRQFTLASQGIASAGILSWYNEPNLKLPVQNRKLAELTEEEIIKAGESFENLSERKASSSKRIGPVGAAKILFALRPEALIPWDNFIKEEMKKRYNLLSYENFLRHVKNKSTEGVI